MRTRRASTPERPDRLFTVTVVDTDPLVRARLVQEVRSLGAILDYSSLDELERVAHRQPTVLVLGPSLSSNGGLERAGSLVRGQPELGVVAVAQQLSTGLLKSAMKAGIGDVVSLEEEPTDLQEAIRRVGRELGGAPADQAHVPAPAENAGHCRMTTVFSTKGGVGKSMVAVNLATVLAMRSGLPVAIVDADLQFGDVCLMLGITPQHTIVDALGAGEHLDRALLGSLLAVDPASGLRVLPAPLEPGFADQIDPPSMGRLIQLLRTMCSHVVVDTCASFTEVVLGLLDASDDIVIVAGMDVPSVKNVKIGVQTLRLLNVSVTKVKLVLNRANSRVGLEVSDVEHTLQLKADVTLPSDIIVPQTINRGVPVVLDSPRSKVARALEQLASVVTPVDAASRR